MNFRDLSYFRAFLDIEDFDLWLDRGHFVGGECAMQHCDPICRIKACGFIAIEVETGNPYAAYYEEAFHSEGTEFKVFGAELHALPEPLKELILTAALDEPAILESDILAVYDRNWIANNPDLDVRSLENSPARALLKSPHIRHRFRKMLDNIDFWNLHMSLMTDSKMYLDRGYLVGGDCRPSLCGFVAIEAATGRPYAAYSLGDDYQFFGASAQSLPAPLKEQITKYESWVLE